jgi:TetR/AcrR family transcriptional repressor of nem operon
MTSATAARLLDAAEARTRRVGFNGFSFRDLAADLEIKSASVHHHFPTKADLGHAMIERYRERVMAALGDPTARPLADQVAAVVAAHRSTLVDLDALCLGAMLGAEASSLPDPVCAGARNFFIAIVDWLRTAFIHAGRAEPVADGAAKRLLATIHGAMIMARTLGEVGFFDQAVTPLVADLAGMKSA